MLKYNCRSFACNCCQLLLVADTAALSMSTPVPGPAALLLPALGQARAFTCFCTNQHSAQKVTRHAQQQQP